MDILKYQEKVSGVVDILQDAGAILYKEGKILGYGVSTDSLHHTITNDPQGDWQEYSCAHAVFKFGKLENPKYLYLKARISKDDGISFGLSSPKISKSSPKLGELEEKTEEYFACYTNSPRVASRVIKIIEEYQE